MRVVHSADFVAALLGVERSEVVYGMVISYALHDVLWINLFVSVKAYAEWLRARQSLQNVHVVCDGWRAGLCGGKVVVPAGPGAFLIGQ